MENIFEYIQTLLNGSWGIGVCSGIVATFIWWFITHVIFAAKIEIYSYGNLHDGFLVSGDFKQKTFLCPAYKKIFAHIEKRIQADNLNEQIQQ